MTVRGLGREKSLPPLVVAANAVLLDEAKALRAALADFSSDPAAWLTVPNGR